MEDPHEIRRVEISKQSSKRETSKLISDGKHDTGLSSQS